MLVSKRVAKLRPHLNLGTIVATDATDATGATELSGTPAGTARTVETLALEVDALRALVDRLQSQVDGLSPAAAAPPNAATAKVAAVTAAVAVGTATAAAVGAPEADPVQAMRSLLSAAFELALQPVPDDDEEADEQFARFAALIHTNRRGTPLLEQSLRLYTWQQLRRNVTIYLNEDQAVGSFETTRMTPSPVTERTQQAKFFVRARTRMPTPITFRRDEAEGGAWRIEASSL